MASSRAKLLFEIKLTTLHSRRVPINTGLPSGCTKIFDRARRSVIENVVDLLKRFLAGLGEQEEDMDEHGSAEDAKDDVDFPADVSERGRHEISERKIERPVCGCGQRNSLSSDTEGIQFWWVDPGDWTPSGSIGGDEEVGASDDSLGWSAGDGDRLGGVAELSWFWHFSVGGEKASVDEKPGHHQEGADEEGWTTTPSVDKQESWDGHEDVDDVLDGGWKQDAVAQASHCENIRYVVHHNVHSSKLRPYLCKNTDMCTIDHLRVEEFEVSDIGVRSLEFNDFSDFGHLFVDEWRVGVTVGVN